MRNTLSKDIEKQIKMLEDIIKKHDYDLNTEYKSPLEKALDALNEARIIAIVDEVVDDK